MEAPLHTTLRRVSTAGLAALILTTSTQTIPTQTIPTQPATPATTTSTTVTDLLSLRTHPAAAARATSATRTAVPAAQKRKQVSAATRRAVINNQRRVKIVAFAKAQKGKWYRYGATGLRNYDCSGLTKRSYRQAGINLPRTSSQQRRVGKRVSAANARSGDLVSFRGHVGVLVGRGTMADAPGAGRRVMVRKIYRDSSLQFRRVIPVG